MSGFQLQRLGMLMEPEPGNPQEIEGVLNPAATITEWPTTGLAWRALTCRISCHREEPPTRRKQRCNAPDFGNSKP